MFLPVNEGKVPEKFWQRIDEEQDVLLGQDRTPVPALKSRQLISDLVSMLLKTLFNFVTLVLRQNKLECFKQNL